MKKIACALLAVLFLLAFVPTAAANEVTVLSYGRISVAMPQITAEIKGTGYDPLSVSAMLGSEPLKVQAVEPYNRSEISTCTYVVVDLSTSMRSSFDLVKKNIIKYADSMRDDDKLVLITFGETVKETVFSGNTAREDIAQTVAALKCDENGTLFFEALNRAYQLSNAAISQYDREYVVAFSDGMDLQRGNTTYEEIADLYKTHTLPIYAACSANSSKDASDRFGELARSSGGSLSIMNNEADFDKLLAEIENVTIVRLLASSNMADGQNRQLSVKIGDSQIEQNIPVARSQADNIPPFVQDIQYDIDRGAVILSYSEKVNGALSTASYRITDENGNRVDVLSAETSDGENTVEVRLGTVHNGTYTMTFQDITDASQEANPLTETKEFRVENVPEEEAPAESSLPVWVIVLLAAVGVLVVLVVILIILRTTKKKTQDDQRPHTGELPGSVSANVLEYRSPVPEQVKHHIQADESVRIRLKIKTGRMTEQTVETTVVSSLIVGRSNICDVYIDDTKLSRQHFAIENDGGSIYILDLQSSNGTVVNGIRVNSRQRLNSGDKIAAGLSDIQITILGR